MDIDDITALDELDPSLSVNKAFGEPLETARGTIIPVARVAAGFGAGFGFGTDDEAGGGGRGGGIAVSPLGVIAVEEDESRFIRTAGRSRWLGVMLALGIAIGLGVGIALTKILTGRAEEPDE